MNIQELLTLIFDSGANSIQIHRNVVRHGNENNEGDYDVLKLKSVIPFYTLITTKPNGASISKR